MANFKTGSIFHFIFLAQKHTCARANLRQGEILLNRINNTEQNDKMNTFTADLKISFGTGTIKIIFFFYFVFRFKFLGIVQSKR